jgi:hypothetical protein
LTVAQLNVKLGVDGIGQIKSALNQVSVGLQQVRDKAAGAASSMAAIGGVAIAGTVAGFGMLGKTAFDAAVSFESLNSRLTAITGSGKKAAEVLDMVRKVAGPSPFTFSQLANLAVGLQAAGLETNAMLPRLANLGAAFGASEEKLASLLMMVQTLKAGQLPDTGQLSMFGMSRSMFAKQGIKFDKGGGLEQGQEMKVFEAFIKIIDTKYSGMLDGLQNDTATKLASLEDSWEATMRKIGEKMITILTPYIEYATDFLGRMMDSGVLGDITEKFFGPMQDFTKGFTDGKVQASVDKLLASIVAVSASIPSILSDTFKNIGTMFQNIMNQFRQMFAKIPFYNDPQYKEFVDKADKIDSFRNSGLYSKERAAAEMADLEKRMGFTYQTDIMGGVDFGKPFADAQKFADSIIGKMAGSKAAETAAAPKPFGPYFQPGEEPGMAGGAAGEMGDLLLRIANNTKDTADALTLRRETLGGGAMGAIGLTGAEVGAVNASYGRFGNGLIPAGTDLERAMRRLIRDEGRRNGQPGIMGRF